jgi:D-alanyl-D-alanine carboxypeptidase (penicillin-binding protein 5/6)/beta-lactamase class A
LEDRLRPHLTAHKGTIAVGVKHLESGETFFHEADRVLPTASLIKFPVLIETYLQADEGKVSLREELTLRERDKVPGSGLLRLHFTEGAKFPLRDAVRLMIAVSDNTATNLVLDRIGLKAVNERMASWGLKETRINAQVFRGSTTSIDKARTAKYGLGSTTAREMVSLWEILLTGNKIRPPLQACILGHLRANDDTAKFTRLLPPDVRVAHKDGAVSAARTDAGVLYTPGGTLIVVVLTDNNADKRWTRDNAGNLVCAQIAKAVYEHYNK